ncbi:MAG: LysM peptidoglycan-binding domain-containing protein [Chloroflexi bacterium]|nr:LysM peptidoglycan-binding domain-containing protein [Chloroflexota bacterium]
MRLVFRATLFLLLGLLAFSLMAPPIAAAPPAGTPTAYTVQAGDTLYSVAVRYHTTVAVLKHLNALKSDLLQVGQQLIVPSSDPSEPAPPAATLPSAPAPSGHSYIVQRGDTLSRIALRYGTTARALADLNDIHNLNLIEVGDALAIPNSSTLVTPGLVLDPPAAHQGGTVMIKVTQPDLVSVSAKVNGETIPFTHTAGYFYGLVGFSRCAKVGSVPLTVTETDATGKTTSASAKITVAATAFPVQSVTIPPGKEALLDPALVKKESDELNAIVGQYTPVRLWSGPFRMPVSGGHCLVLFWHPPLVQRWAGGRLRARGDGYCPRRRHSDLRGCARARGLCRTDAGAREHGGARPWSRSLFRLFPPVGDGRQGRSDARGGRLDRQGRDDGPFDRHALALEYLGQWRIRRPGGMDKDTSSVER